MSGADAQSIPIAAAVGHVPDGEAVALALAPLPASAGCGGLSAALAADWLGAGPAKAGCSARGDASDDSDDDLEGAEDLCDFFGACPAAVPNEKAWRKAAREVMRNPAVRQCAATD